MITWISRPAAAAFALLGLSGCEGGTKSGLFAGLGVSTAAETKPVALSQAKMAKGAFTLVPPEGFCIDQASLKQRFALLARCEALGAPNAGGGAPLGILIVSVTPDAPVGALPTAEQTADALKLARFTAAESENNAITYRAEGAPPVEGMDVVHWRGTAQIGGQLVGLALYGPKGGRAVSGEGREILNSLIRRTRKVS
ncbi:MAG: hypothetical protein WBB25_15890 [Sulfitobacter sp.]